MAVTRTFPEKAVATTAAAASRGIVRISLPALRAAGLLAPEEEERQLAQQYRKIKRPLIVNAVGRGAPPLPNGHVIMLASALAGEGKTFTAVNLALSMSLEKDVHVLLVDADVEKPHVSRLLGVGEAPGLLDVLRNSSLDVEKVILPTDVPNLFVLPAGTASPEATELLASVRMEEVMRAIAALVRLDPAYGRAAHRRAIADHEANGARLAQGVLGDTLRSLATNGGVRPAAMCPASVRSRSPSRAPRDAESSNAASARLPDAVRGTVDFLVRGTGVPLALRIAMRWRSC